jgi:hypothetical protein
MISAHNFLPHPNSNRAHLKYRTRYSRRSLCKLIEWKFPGIHKNQIGWFALKREKKSSAATSRFPARRPNPLSAPQHKKSPKTKAMKRLLCRSQAPLQPKFSRAEIQLRRPLALLNLRAAAVLLVLAASLLRNHINLAIKRITEFVVHFRLKN